MGSLVGRRYVAMLLLAGQLILVGLVGCGGEGEVTKFELRDNRWHPGKSEIVRPDSKICPDERYTVGEMDKDGVNFHVSDGADLRWDRHEPLDLPCGDELRYGTINGTDGPPFAPGRGELRITAFTRSDTGN